MSFNFVEKVMCIGGGDNETPTLQFYKKGFVLHDNGGETPSWQDIILSGNTALTLVNAKANGLNYVKLFGACEQNGTPSPDTPVDIVSNNGALKYGQYGKNLFDALNAPEEFISKSTCTRSVGALHIDVNGSYSRLKLELPELVVGESYTFSFSSDRPASGSSTMYITPDTGSAYSNVVASRYFSTGNYNLTFVAPQSKLFVMFYITTTTAEQFLFNLTNIQLELGDTVTDYEPYHFGIHTDGTVETVTDSLSNTATAEMLLSVDDYKDEQEVLTGAVTRNVGVKVLDGSESWLRGASSFYIDDIITDSLTVNTFNIYCSHYLGALGDAQASELVNANRIRLVYSESYRRLNIFAIMNDYPTVEDFQQFLANQYAAGTPVIIVYPLAEPTTETVTGQTLTTRAGTNIVQITQASIDNLELEVSYKGKI